MSHLSIFVAFLFNITLELLIHLICTNHIPDQINQSITTLFLLKSINQSTILQSPFQEYFMDVRKQHFLQMRKKYLVILLLSYVVEQLTRNYKNKTRDVGQKHVVMMKARDTWSCYRPESRGRAVGQRHVVVM